jgi:hypothetical protein
MKAEKWPDLGEGWRPRKLIPFRAERAQSVKASAAGKRESRG